MIILSAFFGTDISPSGNPSDGLISKTIGINGVTECSTVTNMPSTNIAGRNVLVTAGQVLYSFGGRFTDQNGAATSNGTGAAFKYDLLTGQWNPISTMNHARFWSTVKVMNDHEILIAGNFSSRVLHFMVSNKKNT